MPMDGCDGGGLSELDMQDRLHACFVRLPMMCDGGFKITIRLNGLVHSGQPSFGVLRHGLIALQILGLFDETCVSMLKIDLHCFWQWGGDVCC